MLMIRNAKADRPRRRWVWLVLFALMALGACSAAGGDEETWAAGSEVFFDGLADEYTANDFYGVLDFYAPNAYRRWWRGAVRGGSLVRDLLVWNSGDLAHDVVGLHLGPDGALTLVDWDSAGSLSVLVSKVGSGRITSETVYDHAAWLDVSLRASPEVVERYQDLYAAYAEAWNGRSETDLRSIYTIDATFHETLDDGSVIGLEAMLGMPSKIVTIEPVEMSGAVNTIDATGPAVFLGPADHGVDPLRAVGVYEVTDVGGCTSQMAVVWEMFNGRISREWRYFEVDSVRRCHSDDLPDGWWTELELPPPSDQVETDVLQTDGGHEISIYNGTPRLNQFLLWGVSRFARAGLEEPRFDSVTFEPSRRCVNRSGRLFQDADSRGLFSCVYEDDLCPGEGICDVAILNVRASLLHELGHAWILDNVDRPTETALLELSDRDTWNNPDVPWSERGFEYAAEVLAWGLLDETAPMVRIGRPACQELAAAFELLTGTSPLDGRGNCA